MFLRGFGFSFFLFLGATLRLSAHALLPLHLEEVPVRKIGFETYSGAPGASKTHLNTQILIDAEGRATFETIAHGYESRTQNQVLEHIETQLREAYRMRVSSGASALILLFYTLPGGTQGGRTLIVGVRGERLYLKSVDVPKPRKSESLVADLIHETHFLTHRMIAASVIDTSIAAPQNCGGAVGELGRVKASPSILSASFSRRLQ